MMTQSELALQRLIGSLVDLANNEDNYAVSKAAERLLEAWDEQRGSCRAVWPSLRQKGREVAITVEISSESLQDAIRKVIEDSDFKLVGRA